MAPAAPATNSREARAGGLAWPPHPSALGLNQRGLDTGSPCRGLRQACASPSGRGQLLPPRSLLRPQGHAHLCAPPFPVQCHPAPASVTPTTSHLLPVAVSAPLPGEAGTQTKGPCRAPPPGLGSCPASAASAELARPGPPQGAGGPGRGLLQPAGRDHQHQPSTGARPLPSRSRSMDYFWTRVEASRVWPIEGTRKRSEERPGDLPAPQTRRPRAASRRAGKAWRTLLCTPVPTRPQWAP